MLALLSAGLLFARSRFDLLLGAGHLIGRPVDRSEGRCRVHRYFFTSSTSFANPAVTIGRVFTDTFAGIQPASMPAYVGCQLVGTALAIALIRALYPHIADVAADVVVPQMKERS